MRQVSCKIGPTESRADRIWMCCRQNRYILRIGHALNEDYLDGRVGFYEGYLLKCVEDALSQQ